MGNGEIIQGGALSMNRVYVEDVEEGNGDKRGSSVSRESSSRKSILHGFQEGVQVVFLLVLAIVPELA